MMIQCRVRNSECGKGEDFKIGVKPGVIERVAQTKKTIRGSRFIPPGFQKFERFRRFEPGCARPAVAEGRVAQTPEGGSVTHSNGQTCDFVPFLSCGDECLPTSFSLSWVWATPPEAMAGSGRAHPGIWATRPTSPGECSWEKLKLDSSKNGPVGSPFFGIFRLIRLFPPFDGGELHEFKVPSSVFKVGTIAGCVEMASGEGQGGDRANAGLRTG
jgi:hypothetical protein